MTSQHDILGVRGRRLGKLLSTETTTLNLNHFHSAEQILGNRFGTPQFARRRQDSRNHRGESVESLRIEFHPRAHSGDCEG